MIIMIIKIIRIRIIIIVMIIIVIVVIMSTHLEEFTAREDENPNPSFPWCCRSGQTKAFDKERAAVSHH